MSRTRWFDLGAIALVIAISVGIAITAFSGGAAGSVPTESTARPPSQHATDAPPLTLFIGDSYTAGESSAEMSYGCRAVVEIGSLCAVSAMAGTGFVSGGPANRWVNPYGGESSSLGERIPHLAAQYDPAVVVLDGGRNDVFATRKFVYTEMIRTITAIRRTWPNAQIVFVRPRFLANPGDDLGFGDDFMKQLQSDPATQGVTFVDPISSFADTDTSALLGPDGIHPNHEGYRRLTSALLDSLVSHRVGSAS
jgi:lysophospholipase L1-like esterase